MPQADLYNNTQTTVTNIPLEKDYGDIENPEYTIPLSVAQEAIKNIDNYPDDKKNNYNNKYHLYFLVDNTLKSKDETSFEKAFLDANLTGIASYTDRIKYVGITINPDNRKKEHARNPEKAQYQFVDIKGNLTKGKARVLEQVVISSIGLAKYGEGKLNKINSISSKNEASYGIYEFLRAGLGLNVEAGSLYNRIENEVLLKQEEGVCW